MTEWKQSQFFSPPDFSREWLQVPQCIASFSVKKNMAAYSFPTVFLFSIRLSVFLSTEGDSARVRGYSSIF